MERVREMKKKTTASEKLERKAKDAQLCFPEDPKCELLPGILNEIATDLIAAKLPWRTMYKLSMVNTAWAPVIRNRQVHNARVRSGSTETLLLVTPSLDTPCHACLLTRNITLDTPCHACVLTRNITLVSTTAKSSCNLPGIPYGNGEILSGSEQISVNGNWYHMGGYDWDPDMASDKVYVLDLVGQKQWREAASMIHRRCWFGCGVIDGKIFVFGGVEDDNYTSDDKGTAEMYDPTSNTWSLVKDMPWARTNDKVAQRGDELLLYAVSECEDDVIRHDFSYHPRKDQWSLVEPVTHPAFTMQEKLYTISDDAIHVYDDERKSWSSLHEVSFLGIPCYRDDLHVVNAVAIGDRLLAMVHMEILGGNKLGIFEGYGVGSANKEHIEMLSVKVWRCCCDCPCLPMPCPCDPGAMVTVSI